MLRACELSFENRQNTPVPADNEIAYCSFWWVFFIKMMYYLVDMKNLSFSILCNSALSFCKGK